MGVTIHFETKFVGSQKQLKEKIEGIIKKANLCGFAEAKIMEMDFAKDFNEVDDYTPVGVDDNGRVVIDQEYRWAKIQATPQFPIMSFQDTPEERAEKEKEVEKIKALLPKMHGFVASLWWGEGCEATNLVFISKRGKSARRTWRGHSFTKTQYASDFVAAHVAVCSLLKYAEEESLVVSVNDEAGFYNHGDITKLIDASEENLKMISGMYETFSEFFEKVGAKVEGSGKYAKKLLKDYEI